MDRQLAALCEIFEIANEIPRVLSIHSYRATDLVLSKLRDYHPKGAVLHWWLGTRAETEEVIELGASFSVNASQAKRWASLALVPADRLLLETDHPFGDRSEKPPRQPGRLSRPEAALSSTLGISVGDLRQQTWRNMRRIADELNLVDMFPKQFQVQFLAA